MGLSRSQYLTIEREYSRRLNRDREEQQRRIAEAFERVPELRETEEELADLAREKAVALLQSDNRAAVLAADRREELKKKKYRLLKEAGYPADYLELHYECELCRDTGFTGQGECRCRRQEVIRLLYDQSCLKEVLEEENFSTFRLDYYDREQKEDETGLTGYDLMVNNLAVCRKFTDEFEPGRENLLLVGQTGTGKTFLSHCIAKELLDRYFSVLYLTASELFETLAQHAFSREEEEMAEDPGQIFTCDFLIIDDLGTEFTNRFVTSQLFTCINERLLRRKSTLISTNLSMNDMLRIYTERVTSRLIGSYRILRFPERDIRLYKRMQSR